MSQIPVKARLKDYRGGKHDLQMKIAEENLLRQKIVDHLNSLIANNPAEDQQYSYANLAHALNVDLEIVRAAIAYGGHNAITLRVTAEDREKLTHLKR